MKFFNDTHYLKKMPSEIIAEYTLSAGAVHDYQKAKWGSHAGMVNRFCLAMQLINWQRVKYWLDIGCGPGNFFSHVEDMGYRFEQLKGIDITPAMVSYAKMIDMISPVSFEICNFLQTQETKPAFDLVTLLGVLQQCGAPPHSALQAAVSQLKSQGQLFLTTKNIGWKAFASKKVIPEKTHSWFSPSEIGTALKAVNMEVVACSGFIPRSNKIVPFTDSHTMFFLARKA